MSALEHQVRFSNLYERRAEVIARLYALLVNLQNACQKFVFVGAYETDMTKRQEEFRKTREILNEVGLFFEGHQIFLSDNVSALLVEFFEAVGKPVASVWVYEGYTNGPPNFRAEKVEALSKSAEAFKLQIPTIRAALRDEFRKILGVEVKNRD
jgi:hypothetical protein